MTCERCGLPEDSCLCGNSGFELGTLASAVDSYLRGVVDKEYLRSAFDDLVEHDDTVRKALT